MIEEYIKKNLQRRICSFREESERKNNTEVVYILKLVQGQRPVKKI